MSYGLIVEGAYDEGVFCELVRKTVTSEGAVIVRVCDGVAALRKQFPAYLRDLEHVLQGRPVDKALVIRDWAGPDPISEEQRMSQVIQGRQFAFPQGIHFCCVRQEMETWLLADIGAINALAHERGGRNVAPVSGQLEEIVHPKERLMRVLSEARLPYDAAVCREIAEDAR
jgi:hypothetical protein